MKWLLPRWVCVHENAWPNLDGYRTVRVELQWLGVVWRGFNAHLESGRWINDSTRWDCNRRQTAAIKRRREQNRSTQ